MGCLYVDREASGRGGATGRVSDAVVQRMRDMAAGRRPHGRPLLLFPEGTTSNGHFLLPFKTGAFLAGLPLRPVVMRYSEVRRMGRVVVEAWGVQVGWAASWVRSLGGGTSCCVALLGLPPSARRHSYFPATRQPAGYHSVFTLPTLQHWLLPSAGPLQPCMGDDPGVAPHVSDYGQPLPQRHLLRAAGVPPLGGGEGGSQAVRRQCAQAHGESLLLLGIGEGDVWMRAALAGWLVGGAALGRAG